MNAVALKPDETPRYRSKLDFHMGEALCRVAAEYPSVVDVILEQVQNAIDAGAKHVLVVVNHKTRNIAIRDDGNGVSQNAFEGALTHVGQSQKLAHKLGRFGIGLVSPLGKCERFTFTSCPKGVDFGFKEWTFITDDIRKESQDVSVPLRIRNDIMFVSSNRHQAPKGITTVMWRTEVKISDYSRDKTISRIDSIESLRDAIFERFSAAMRRHKVELSLRFTKADGTKEELDKVKPQPFTGRPLKELAIYDGDAGRVDIKLFLATKTTKGQKGKVLVGEADNDFRFGFDLFARSTDGLLTSEVVAGLTSGVFEGEIVAANVKLHSTRRAFENDDALVGFCAAIDSWYQKHGAKHIEEVNEARKEQRYQDLGQESLKEIQALLEDPAFADIRSVISQFRLGSADPSCDIETKVAAGKQDENAILTDFEDSTSKSGESSGEGGSSSTERKPRQPNPDPFTIAGPRGHKRALVKRGNLGLQFSYVAMDGSDRLWELDIRQGILHFNVNHPTWVACDVSDRKVRQLQETVAIQALMIEVMPDEYKDDMRFAFDMALRPLVHLYHVSPAFTVGRRKMSKD